MTLPLRGWRGKGAPVSWGGVVSLGFGVVEL